MIESEAPRATLEALLGAAPADPAAALRHAADRARDRAFVVLPLGLQAAAEIRELASLHAAIALQSVRHGQPMAPTVLLSAGPVLRDGAPGGAADFLLALALSLDENPLIHAAACPLGGASTSNAVQHDDLLPTGFYIGPATVRRSIAAGRQPGPQLVQGEAPALVAALGDAFHVTGPSFTADSGPPEPGPGGIRPAHSDVILRAVLISMS